MVDGIAIISSPRLFDVQNNYYEICYANLPLGDGPHTLAVNVTVADNQTFWFDRIEYVPSDQNLLKVEQGAVKVSKGDVSVRWVQNNSSFKVTLPFYGKL
jgi:hypothetical protein